MQFWGAKCRLNQVGFVKHAFPTVTKVESALLLKFTSPIMQTCFVWNFPSLHPATSLSNPLVDIPAGRDQQEYKPA